MSYSTKNYTEQGGEKTVIGGTLEIQEGATVTGLPEGSGSAVSPATETVLGGIKAAEKTEGDTVEAKIGSDDKLYVPAYPVVPEFPVADAQTDSTATELAGLVTDFNALLDKLKTAGLMASED